MSLGARMGGWMRKRLRGFNGLKGDMFFGEEICLYGFWEFRALGSRVQKC